MFEQNDIDYFRRRESEERERAAAAPDPTIAAIHAEMANRYAERLNIPAWVPAYVSTRMTALR